jgi:two-component system cell cycle response regulator DivK
MAAVRRLAARRPATSPGAHDAGRRHAHPGGRAVHVLVVDDVEDNREIYTEYLAHHGFHVEQAIHGEEALRKIAATHPDVIVMDLAMPVLDGWEATQRIKTDDATKHIVVIALTGHVYGDNLRRAHEVGADAVLTKPCTPETLLDLIRQLVDA